MGRPLPLLLVLAACEPRDPDGDDTGTCGAEAPDLPASATWESDEATYGTGLGWGDVDGDGHRDLVVASGNDMEPGPVSVHHGGPGGLSEAPDSTSGHAFHGHLAIGDVDGDGYDDVVVARFLGLAGFEEPGGADLYRGGADGLAAAPAWSADGFHSFSVALGDVDLDGDLDLAVAVGQPYGGDAAPSRLYRNDGGVFGTDPIWTSQDGHALDVAFVDAGGDGDLDLVFARHDAPHVRYDNDGGIGAEPAWTAAGFGFDGNSLDFGDVDGDGLPDLLVTDTEPGLARLYCGPAWDLCWSRPGSPVLASAASLVDVDGDDDLDAVIGSWWGLVEVWPNACGALGERTAWRSEQTAVLEAFAWHDLDGAEEEPGSASGTGLVAVPRGARVVSVDPHGAAIGDGYVSAPGPVSVAWELSRAPDLAVSNWDPEQGTWLFERGLSTVP